LRKLKYNRHVKAVVLRVDSPGGALTACETIFQEIQDLPKDVGVVVSFGNVSASGGYYISSNAKRIFASPTTITGSIGVFMLRVDLRGLAKQYGITFDSVVDSVATSDTSGSFDPFSPLNHRMKDNFSDFSDRAYLRFKTLVGVGRKMDLDMVETVAQGRVWTGEQAKQIGLVDELGGLDRAIAYCQRNYTASGQATVVSWPPKQSLWDLLLTKEGADSTSWEDVDFSFLWLQLVRMATAATQGASSTSTSSTATGILGSLFPVNDASVVPGSGGGPPRFPLALSGMMLTADENWAIRCLLQENDVPDILANFPPSFWE
jgi:signal peptide peptidase SppA